jgi:hypothetical protein
VAIVLWIFIIWLDPHQYLLGEKSPRPPYYLSFFLWLFEWDCYNTRKTPHRDFAFSLQPPIPIIRNAHHPHLAFPPFPQMRKMGFGGEKEREVGGVLSKGTAHVHSVGGIGFFYTILPGGEIPLNRRKSQISQGQCSSLMSMSPPFFL